MEVYPMEGADTLSGHNNDIYENVKINCKNNHAKVR